MPERDPKNVIRIGDARIETAWHGAASSGPVVVMLHEGLGCVAMWRDFPDRLSHALGLRVLSYSREGYGGSSPVRLPRPLTYMHDEASGGLPLLLRALGIDDVVLFGHSDGASIALLFASRPADVRVHALVVEAAHVFCEDISVASIAKAREAYLHGDLRSRLERYHGANTECAFWGWNDAWLDPGFRAWNIEASLPHVRAPSLVLQSEQDPYGTLAQVEAIERGSGGSVTRKLMGSGHSPHRETPSAVLDAVKDFLVGHGIVSSGQAYR